MQYLRYLILLIFFSSCQKTYLTVQEHWVDIRYLASTYVHTLDPMQEDPPEGKKILIGWDVPLSVYQRDLSLVLTARLWDQTEHSYQYEIDEKRGYTTMYFSSKDPNKKLLTYKIDVKDKQGEVLENWEHQFWTTQILSEEDA